MAKDYWNKIVINSEYGSFDKINTYDKYGFSSQLDYMHYTEQEYQALKKVEIAHRAAKQEKERIQRLPHYVQVYVEDLPGDIVSTKWVLFPSKHDIAFDYHSREIRTMIYQDGDQFFYTELYKSKHLAKPQQLTEDETRDFMFVMLKADRADYLG